jgi:predicted metal-dependent phosphoesterase TrpH
MRCDLHVHTTHSGMCTVPILRKFCRESYNQPLEVYEKLKRLGMDLVTVTDHDSIDAVEDLRSRPDFFLSEEVTCTLPSGNQLHVGVYDITERDHIELQRRRHDCGRHNQ